MPICVYLTSYEIQPILLCNKLEFLYLRESWGAPGGTMGAEGIGIGMGVVLESEKAGPGWEPPQGAAPG